MIFISLVFRSFFLFCFGSKIAAHVTAFLPRHFYDKTIFRLIFPRTIWRFFCRKRIVHWGPCQCVCGRNYSFDEFPFFIFTPKKPKTDDDKKAKLAREIRVKRLYGYIFFQNDRSNKYFASHSENVQYVLPTKICFWNTNLCTQSISNCCRRTRERYTPLVIIFFLSFICTRLCFYVYDLKRFLIVEKSMIVEK